MTQSIAKIFDNINNVIIRDGENNGYDGSDFYHVYFDVSSGLIKKHIHSSTRYSGYNPLVGNNVSFDELDENQQQIVELASIAQATNLIKESSENTFFKGDTAIVFKGRKYPKGMKFVVTSSSYYRDRFNRIQSNNLDGFDEDGNSIRINVLNCKVYARAATEEHVNEVRDGLLLDPEKNYYLRSIAG